MINQRQPSRPHYSVATPHLAEPVTYAEAAAHCRVDSDTDKDYITALVAVAREYVENLTGRAATRAGYRVVANSWESFSGSPFYGPVAIRLDRTPLASVESVKYYAPGESDRTEISETLYTAITGTEPGALYLEDPIPEVDATRPDAIEILFTAGHRTARESPPIMRHAIKLMVGHLYETRTPISQGSVVEIPHSLMDLIKSIRVGGAFA